MDRRLLLSACCVVALSVATAAAAAYFYTMNMQRNNRNKKLRHAAKDKDKPQTTFNRVLADNSYSPFTHLQLPQQQQQQSGTGERLHPYEDQIQCLLEQCPHQLRFWDISEPTSMEGPYSWIDNASDLEALLHKLGQEKVFAVDTEQHSIRSFLGFTALIQISTQQEDYLIDTIALHDDMSLLHSVFSDPAICKVFHGADNDVLWLQRDFHIYVVNLFDTAKACDVLGKPHKSLAYLLQTYCSVHPDKSFQRADWRIRPLPDAMVNYARADAHYLLYIAECLSAELNEIRDVQTGSQAIPKDQRSRNLFEECFYRSNLITLQLYEKDSYSTVEATISSLLSRYYNTNGRGFDKYRDKKKSKVDSFEEFVRKLCIWRDFVARTEDESLRFVLSDQALILLARTRPKSPEKIYDTISAADAINENNDESCFMTPFPSPSPVIDSYIEDLCNLFKDSLAGNMFNGEFMGISLKRNGTRNTKSNIYHVKVSKQRSKEASRAQFVQKFSCKAPVYHNCRIYASDGRLLCYCDHKKLEWYLSRQLAEVVQEDPPAIKLLFEPKGRPEDENNEFYIQSKQNICVGCGESNHYLRYRIIPSCYRMHFPEYLKSHRSHDIVLLCVDCHEIAHAAAEKYKRKIANDFGIPLFTKKVVDSGNNATEAREAGSVDGEKGVSPLQLRTAAMALLRHGTSMPNERRQQLESVIKSYYKGRNITQEDLEAALFVGMGLRERRRLIKKSLPMKNHDQHASCSNINDGTKNSLTNSSVDGKERDVMVKSESIRNKEPLNDVVYEALSFNIDGQEEHDAVIPTQGRIIFEGGINSPSRTSGKKCRNESMNSFIEFNSLTTSNDVSENPALDLYEKDRVGSSSEAAKSGVPVSEMVQKSPNISEMHTRSEKISLLGHGPHGKKVVERILDESGEDGIRKFCQQWRTVFVEAVQPRFLPSGWDIHHRQSASVKEKGLVQH